ncbi:DUF402 domain-containing protein [Kribbella monticola]|uniref:DUF402 domain-containing protein n=1 Tax=Kribbella monticola TaxID=2185285 RepID=UPI0018E51881|nr:DUF402 domain-containing protein [Kribbella monticola]
MTYAPAGTLGVYASSRGVAGREGLSRAERKLAAMETLVYNAVEAPADLATLTFRTRGAWSSINLGWSGPDFAGWYVNFELPYDETQYGLRTMDLVLDLLVDPAGNPQLKDQDDYAQAVARGILDVPVDLEEEAARVLRELGRRRGPFDPSWIDWRPDPSWSTPVLPPELRLGGAAWSVGVELGDQSAGGLAAPGVGEELG